MSRNTRLATSVRGHRAQLRSCPTMRCSNVVGASRRNRLHTRRHTFNGEQRIDPLDRLGRDRRLVDPLQIEELASPMGPAGSLDNRSGLAVGLVQSVEPNIGVCLHQSRIVGQMLLRMVAATIARNRRTPPPADLPLDRHILDADAGYSRNNRCPHPLPLWRGRGILDISKVVSDQAMCVEC